MIDRPLAVGHAPAWAVAWGQDGHGVFADAVFAGVVQRMRWIPPGAFWMGSPDDEVGRWEDEGPRHQVTISRGYWLGETPVTQALWRAVMGVNPSRFHDDERPVELVSFEDTRRFLDAISEPAPGFSWRLPTEAEWERACRAGTSTATWAGDLKLRGQNDAPMLDAIAWYGGNSGHRYDLGTSVPSGWREQQFPHERAGSRKVGCRALNPWGLKDMLGNVWEWCDDVWGPYGPDHPVTPLRTSIADTAPRVIRGGSWFSSARNCRAACRLFQPPAHTDHDLGFRLAFGPPV